MSSLSPPLNEGIGADTTLRGCSELEEWITLQILLTKNSDYHIVGNNYKVSLLTSPIIQNGKSSGEWLELILLMKNALSC